LLAFWNLIGALKPDLTHHVAMKPVAYAGCLARLRGVPAVVHAVTGLGYLFIRDDLITRIRRAIIMRLFRFALHHRDSRVIFQNPDDRDLFVQKGLVDPAITTIIRGTGVDMGRFKPSGTTSHRVTVMFPARIIGDKGIHEFVHAARQLTSAGFDADFVVVGRTDPNNPTAVLQDTVRGWERDGILAWWGFQDDMAAMLPRADIVCMPSYREGLPRVLIEAAACGLPIVTTDVPGCREIVHHEVNGLLVAARDGPATADAIARLIEDATLRRRMGEKSREMACRIMPSTTSSIERWRYTQRSHRTGIRARQWTHGRRSG
jgi:glycosyltransferase involved in cell wall biosynthesis